MSPEQKANKHLLSMRNIIVLGIAFMVIFLAFYCTSMASEIILERSDDGDLDGYGYLGLSIMNLTMGVFSLIVPYLANFMSIKLGLIISAMTITIYISTFVYPVKWAICLSSGLVGCGTAVLMTLHGVYISKFSGPSRVYRNFSIFNVLFDLNHLVGGILFVILLTQVSAIDSDSRVYLIVPFIIISALGCVFLFFLKNVPIMSKMEEENKSTESVLRKTLNDAKCCFKNKHYWSVCIMLIYLSFQLAMFEGILATSLSHIERFGERAKYIAGLVNLISGTGSIIVSGLCSLTSHVGVLTGLTTSFLAESIFLISLLISIPEYASLYSTNDLALYQFEPNIYIAMICVFFNGTVVSVWTIRVYSLTNEVFPEDHSCVVFGYAFIQTFECFIGTFIFYFGEELRITVYYTILLITGLTANIMYYVSKRRLNDNASKPIENWPIIVSIDLEK